MVKGTDVPENSWTKVQSATCGVTPPVDPQRTEVRDEMMLTPIRGPSSCVYGKDHTPDCGAKHPQTPMAPTRSRAAPSSLQKHFDSERAWKLPLPPLPAPFSSPHELDVGDHPAKHAFASISFDNIAEMCSSLIRAVHSFVPLFCPKQTVIKKHGFSPGKPRKNPGVASSVATIVPKGLSYNHSEDANASYKARYFEKKRILRKERYKHYYLGSPQSSTIQKKWELYQVHDFLILGGNSKHPKLGFLLLNIILCIDFKG